MPELDFIQTQTLQEDTRTRGERARDYAVLALILLLAYGAFLLGLAIENVWLLIGYLAVVTTVIYGVRRQKKIGTWFSSLFKANARFASVFISLLFVLYPVIFIKDPYLIHLGALSAIFVIMGLGLNITLGFAGLLDVGFAVYFAAGAYTSAQLAVHFGTSFWIGLPLGGLVAAFFGFIVAWPALRVHGHYLAMVTLGYGMIMNLLHRNLKFLTNGTDGIINIPPPAIGAFDFLQPITIGGFELPFQANFYYLALALVAFTIYVSIRLRDSKLGRSWEAIREDEVAAKCFGVNLTSMKVVAFSTGAFFGGLGGAVFAHMIGFIHPDNFVLLVSITILASVIIGGMGNIFGVALGAVLLTMIPERLREFADLRMLLFGIALLLIMIYRPQGLFPSVRRRRELQSQKLYGLIEKSGKASAVSGNDVGASAKG